MSSARPARKKGRASKLGILSEVASSQLPPPPPVATPAAPLLPSTPSAATPPSDAQLDLTALATRVLSSPATNTAFDPSLPTYFDGATPPIPNLALPGDTYAGVDYSSAFASSGSSSSAAGDFGLDGNAHASGSGSARADSRRDTEADIKVDEQDDDAELEGRARTAALDAVDAGAGLALAANNQYQQEILNWMRRLAKATTRTEELQVLVKDMSEVLAHGPDLRVVAPGTVHVTLPWFKHFHGKDLPPNPEGVARDLYLSTIRQVSWTVGERSALKREIVAHNKREFAIQAQALGLDIDAALAEHDESFFVETTEFLDWEKIALVMARRNAVECKIQWMQHDHPSINKAKWTKDETAKLYQIADAKGCRDWAGIAAELGTGRAAAECLRQYRRRAQPKQDWTAEEDEKLREGVRLHGENWQSVARLVGRHSNQCINRWTKTVRPTIKKGRWTADEDAALREAHQAVGNSWKQIAQRVRGRTDAQCRERWVNVLDPNIVRTKEWADEEEKQLVGWREDDGKSWAEISAAFLGRRTDNQCMRKYGELVKRRTRPPKEKQSVKRRSRAVKAAANSEENEGVGTPLGGGEEGTEVDDEGAAAVADVPVRRQTARAKKVPPAGVPAPDDDGMEVDEGLPAHVGPQPPAGPVEPVPDDGRARRSMRARAPRTLE